MIIIFKNIFECGQILSKIGELNDAAWYLEGLVEPLSIIDSLMWHPRIVNPTLGTKPMGTKPMDTKIDMMYLLWQAATQISPQISWYQTFTCASIALFIIFQIVVFSYYPLHKHSWCETWLGVISCPWINYSDHSAKRLCMNICVCDHIHIFQQCDF